MGKISVTFNVLEDNGKTLLIPDDVPVSDLVKILAKSEGLPEDQIVIMVSRVVDLESTLRELSVQSGDVISVLRVHMQASRVGLVLASPRNAHPPFVVRRSPAILGRVDPQHPEKRPEIDLTEVLSKMGKERNISRQQAEFTEENGVWRVRLHESASSPMFVDNQRLGHKRYVELSENNVLSIGPAPTRSILQLVVGFETGKQ